MVKVSIKAKSKEKIAELKEFLPKFNIEVDDENPDLIISYGGDGLFLHVERENPKVPKVLMRDSRICKNCPNLMPEEILERISKKQYRISELPKLKAVYNNKKELLGVNDIVFRNKFPTEAIRFKYKINNENYTDEFIGDGLVIATPFGSKKGAYFYTITRKRIKGKIGFAFNNVTTSHKNTVVGLKDKIEIKITRNDGYLVADNDRNYIEINEGDIINISLAKEKAKIVNFNFNS